MKLKELRKNAGMTQFLLAQKSGISQGLISLYERQEKMPGLDNLVKLADALNVSLDELVERRFPRD